MRILVLGDTHGGFPWLQKSIKYAVAKGCDRIVQVGDFGFVPWPHHRNQKLLQTVSAEMVKAEIELYWLDGNHENFDEMERLGASTNAKIAVGLEPNVTYLPRGYRWEWEGVRFMSFGGAISVDKDHRIVGTSWWPQEKITPDQVAHAVIGGEVDILFTHDAPQGANSYLQRALDEQSPTFSHKLGRDSRYSRVAIATLADAIRPKQIIHGHYHADYVGDYRTPNGTVVTVRGLNRDGHPGAWHVLEISDGKVLTA